MSADGGQVTTATARDRHPPTKSKLLLCKLLHAICFDGSRKRDAKSRSLLACTRPISTSDGAHLPQLNSAPAASALPGLSLSLFVLLLGYSIPARDHVRRRRHEKSRLKPRVTSPRGFSFLDTESPTCGQGPGP
jgi:hypothetical protein